MNAKQLDTWQQLVQQCKTQCARQPYSSINVASKIRSDAIVAADALAQLVTEETTELLERLADLTHKFAFGKTSRRARALAAEFRRALDDKQS